MAYTGFHFPEDVLVEILVRLPVKPLVRFKRVCKSWYALIQNPSFISRHLNSSDHFDEDDDDDNSRVVLKHWKKVTRTASVSFLSNETTTKLSAILPAPFFDDDNVVLDDITFYGPCNGVFCVFGDHNPTSSYGNPTSLYGNRRYRRGDLVALWNPATGEIKRLLYSSFPHGDGVDVVSVEIGFGFDHRSNDYKVVRILDFEVGTLVEVYNLSTDCWRKIDAFVPMRLRGQTADSTYSHGFYYWWSGFDNGQCVISFDFTDEVFEVIPPPELARPAIFHIRNYNGCIALVADDSWDESIVHCHALWVLNKDGNKKTWTQLFDIMFDFECVRFEEFSSIGMVCIAYEEDDHEKYKLVLYEPRTRELANLGIYDLDNFSLQAVYYVQSLVSFK